MYQCITKVVLQFSWRDHHSKIRFVSRPLHLRQYKTQLHSTCAVQHITVHYLHKNLQYTTIHYLTTTALYFTGLHFTITTRHWTLPLQYKSIHFLYKTFTELTYSMPRYYHKTHYNTLHSVTLPLQYLTLHHPTITAQYTSMLYNTSAIIICKHCQCIWNVTQPNNHYSTLPYHYEAIMKWIWITSIK